jgi:hypothetical protein
VDGANVHTHACQRLLFNAPCTNAGLSEDQLTELAYVLAHALNDGMRERILIAVLDSQLDLTSEQAVGVRCMLDRCGLMTFNSACKVVPEMAECVVRSSAIPSPIDWLVSQCPLRCRLLVSRVLCFSWKHRMCIGLQGDVTKLMHMTLLIRCHLLKALKYDTFSRWRDFRIGCDTAAATILALAESFQEPVRASHSGASPQRHRLIATIRSAMRRLAEPDEACFDDEEHAGAQIEPLMVAALCVRSASCLFRSKALCRAQCHDCCVTSCL